MASADFMSMPCSWAKQASGCRFPTLLTVRWLVGNAGSIQVCAPGRLQVFLACPSFFSQCLAACRSRKGVALGGCPLSSGFQCSAQTRYCTAAVARALSHAAGPMGRKSSC